MTPAARIAAAIDILDQFQQGQAAEKILTRWARQNRYAGSKDRAAVRDHIYDALRQLRSATHAGAGADGRAIMLGLLRLQGSDPSQFFTGEGHAPAPLTDQEAQIPTAEPTKADQWNLQDWLIPAFEESLGPQAEATAIALQTRAPVVLRVNIAKSDRDAAARDLAHQDIMTTPNLLCETALTLTQGARKLRNSESYQSGQVELQDAASQAVVDLLPDALRVLDYCCGGGGKALAIAAQPDRQVWAHDIDPGRMVDLPIRARRAGVNIAQIATSALTDHAPFDLVLCDAPCSGSGAWRRAPEGKWTLTPEKLQALTQTQDDILHTAAQRVRSGGHLVYATCSVLRCENEDRIAKFLDANPAWECVRQQRFDVSDSGDGFFTAHLTAVSDL